MVHTLKVRDNLAGLALSYLVGPWDQAQVTCPSGRHHIQSHLAGPLSTFFFSSTKAHVYSMLQGRSPALGLPLYFLCHSHLCPDLTSAMALTLPLPTVKNTMLIPDSQKLLRCELESLRTQLQAQSKVSPLHLLRPVLIHLPTPGPHLLSLQAFEFLNHSVTMLEKESCLQQIKIQQLEGEGETEPGSEEVCGGWKISSRSRL